MGRVRGFGQNLGAVLFLALAMSCCAKASEIRPDQLMAPSETDAKGAVTTLLERWHKAAALADAKSYFGAMSADAVFIGTDSQERWDRAAFEAFARPFFAKGKAWTMVPKRRHIQLSQDRRVAWFDEQLQHTKYGQLRGSGVCVWDSERWFIAHYVLSFPIPNDASAKVQELISGR